MNTKRHYRFRLRISQDKFAEDVSQQIEKIHTYVSIDQFTVN